MALLPAISLVVSRMNQFIILTIILMNNLGNSRGNEDSVATQESNGYDTLEKDAREYDFEKEDFSRKNGEERRSRFLIEEVEEGDGNRTFGDPLRSHKSTNVYDKFSNIDEDEVNDGEDSSLQNFINILTTDGVYGEDGGHAYVKEAVRRELVATRRASSAARRPRTQADGRRRRSIIEDLMKVYK